jgi:hydroxymethylbilane synthase
LQEKTIRIGTRGSPLALAQAHEVRARLIAAHGIAEHRFEIIVIKTTGDQITGPLSEVGGKGLFTKELEEALLANEIDLAVHSMKDVATVLPDGLTITAILPREDVRDAFISLKYATLDDVPAGARIGTSSLRRQAQVKLRRPDLEVIGFRGNVQTRLKKLSEGVADATFLACAGLKRLDLTERITSAVETDVMLPAVAQAAISIEIRADDEDTAALAGKLNDERTALCVTAERAFLRVLDGSCRTPIAGLAELDGGQLRLRGQLLSPDGSQEFSTVQTGPAASAIAIGERAAHELLERAGPNFLASFKQSAV